MLCFKYNIPSDDTFATPQNKVCYFSGHRTHFTNPWLLLVISSIILILARGACNVFFIRYEYGGEFSFTICDRFG